MESYRTSLSRTSYFKEELKGGARWGFFGDDNSHPPIDPVVDTPKSAFPQWNFFEKSP